MAGERQHSRAQLERAVFSVQQHAARTQRWAQRDPENMYPESLACMWARWSVFKSRTCERELKGSLTIVWRICWIGEYWRHHPGEHCGVVACTCAPSALLLRARRICECVCATSGFWLQALQHLLGGRDVGSRSGTGTLPVPSTGSVCHDQFCTTRRGASRRRAKGTYGALPQTWT